MTLNCATAFSIGKLTLSCSCPRKSVTTPIFTRLIITRITSGRCCAARRMRSCRIGNGCQWRITAVPVRWYRAEPTCGGRRGISAARPVPGQELLHQHFAVGGDVGSAGSISETVATSRSRTATVSSREDRFHVRHSTGGEIADGEDENAAHNYANEFPKSLLEHFPAARASHRRRMQSSAGRFAREWND